MAYDITFTNTVFRATIERKALHLLRQTTDDVFKEKKLTEAAQVVGRFVIGNDVGITELVKQMDIHLEAEINKLIEEEL